MIIIGITGTFRAGKGTIAKYLVEEKGFKHFSVSGYIDEELTRRQIRISRDSQRIMGNELRAKNGNSFIVSLLYERAMQEGVNAVIESIRNPEEAIFLQRVPNAFLIAVDADPEIRFQRAIVEGGPKDGVSYSRFREQEGVEMTGVYPDEQNLAECARRADFRLENNSDLTTLGSEIDKILKVIKKRITGS